MTDETKHIPIYIRVSSDDQVHGTSLQSQLHECKAALKRDELTPGEVFADEGESAKSIETRPAFLRLLDHIKEHRPPAVMVHKIDRFARNNLEAQIVRSKLTKLGCRLLSATEAISDDPSGKFMFDVLSAVAEYDNRLRSERCRQGMVSQVAQGWWVHGPPLGYNTARTAQNKPTLTPDESRAPMIAEAFKLAASGVTQVEILSEVTAMGLTTKSGKKVTAQTLSRILNNPAYAGFIQGKLAGEKPMKGRWPALVSEEIYAKAQDRSLVGLRTRLKPGAFSLRGLLTCGECGKKLTASNSRGSHKKYGYYHCPMCGLRFPLKVVEDAIQERIDSLAMSEAALDSLEKMVNEMMRENFAPAKKEKEKAAKRVAMLEEKMDRLIELRLTGGIPRPKYETKKAEIETQLMMARLRYADFDAEKVDLIAEFDRARQFLMDPGGYWRTASALEKQMTFQLFFEGPISVNRVNKKVGTIELTVPTCAIWYTRRDSNSRPPV